MGNFLGKCQQNFNAAVRWPKATTAMSPQDQEPTGNGVAHSGNAGNPPQNTPSSHSSQPPLQPIPCPLPQGASPPFCEEAKKLFIRKSLIGMGNVAKVYLATRVSDSKPVAVKVFHKRFDPQPPQLNEREREVKAYFHLKPHQNLVRCEGVYEFESQTLLAMEYVDGGNMMDLICKTRRGLDEQTVIKIMRQVFKGLEHMHSQGIAHRYVSMSNIVQTKKGVVKLVDFGTANFGHPGRRNMSKVRSGSLAFCAPEVIGVLVPVEFAIDMSFCAEEADMWSAGIVCHALLTKSLPFGRESEESVLGHQQQRIIDRIFRQSWGFKHVTPSMRSLMQGLIRLNSEERLTATEAIAMIDKAQSELDERARVRSQKPSVRFARFLKSKLWKK